MTRALAGLEYQGVMISSGLWEDLKVVTPVTVDARTGGAVQVNEEEYRNRTCQYCTLLCRNAVTNSYKELWEHRSQYHDITPGNQIRIKGLVDEITNGAEELRKK